MWRWPVVGEPPIRVEQFLPRYPARGAVSSFVLHERYPVVTLRDSPPSTLGRIANIRHESATVPWPTQAMNVPGASRDGS